MKTYNARHGAVPSQKRPLYARLLIATTLALGLLALPVALDTFIALETGALALAGNGNGPGGPDDGGGGGDPGAGGGNGGPGGNMGGGKGGGKPDKGGLYGDQVYILRDGFGLPILYIGTDGEGNDYSCFQPLAIGGAEGWTVDDAVTLPLAGQFPDPNDIKLDAEMEAFCEDPVLAADRLRTRDRLKIRDKDGTYDRDRDRERIRAVIRLHAEDDTELDGCDVVPVCADNATEVELGRLSVLRAPPKVLDRQRDEAIRTINKYYPDVLLDHGGRLVVNGATFDSPLINLALMREFLNWGALLDGGYGVWVPDEENFGNPDVDYTFLNAAAFGLGAGDDKLGAGVDQEVVIRSYLTIGIPFTQPEPMLPVLTVDPDDDPSGVTAGRAYLDFSGYEYDRGAVFPGDVCWDEPRYDANGYVIGYDRERAHLLDAVFDGEEWSMSETDVGYSGLKAFAQTADDARRVMLFVHDHNVVHVDPVFETDPGFVCPPLN